MEAYFTHLFNVLRPLNSVGNVTPVANRTCIGILKDRISVSRLLQMCGSAFSQKFLFVRIFLIIEYAYLGCGFIHRNGSQWPDYQIGENRRIVG